MCAGPIVSLDQLTKTFRVRRASGSGLIARAVNLFAPATETVTAVDRVSFSTPGVSVVRQELHQTTVEVELDPPVRHRDDRLRGSATFCRAF